MALSNGAPTPSNSYCRAIELENTAISEARLLHPGNDGYFAIATKVINNPPQKNEWTEKRLHMSGLEKALLDVKNAPNMYISQASFVTPTRLVSATKSLSCCFVDLDCYNVDILPNDDTVQAILDLADKFKIPRPSYVVNSGCGLYAKWLFDTPLADTDLQLWSQAESLLIKLFSSLGADPKARDAARVLRPLTTVNSKNGGVVRVMYQGGVFQSFSELVSSLRNVELSTNLAFSEKKQSQLKVKVNHSAAMEVHSIQNLGHLIEYSDNRLGSLAMGNMSIKSLAWSRFLDIRDLMIRRGGAKRGSRDLFIFWMTNMLAGANVIRPDNFWGEVEELLISFPHSKDFVPLYDGSLSTLYKRVEATARAEKVEWNGKNHSPIYTPKNDKLINIFEITSDEETKMRTIISTQEKRRRADAKVPGRLERREQRGEMQKVADELRRQGMSGNEISKQLGFSQSTISRWFKESDGKPMMVADLKNLDANYLQELREQRARTLQYQRAQREQIAKRERNLQEAREAQANLELASKVNDLRKRVANR